MWAPLEDYALLADGRAAALLSRTGSIDWLCLPRFDHAAAMSALLGDERHGMWIVAPVNGPRTTRRAYREDTMVVETEIAAEDGKVRLIDCMPVETDRPRVIRIVQGLEGRVALHVQLVLSLDYGTMRPVVKTEDGRVVARAGPDGIVLDTDVELRQREQSSVAYPIVEAGDELVMVLTHFPAQDPVPPRPDARAEVDHTTSWWRGWLADLRYDGDHADAVRRSTLVLKSLSYWPTGGMVTSPTTALPELLGGGRNWDYRYCWLRDSSFAMSALLMGGLKNEADAWRDWIVRATTAAASKLQPVFGPAGERRLHEIDATWLPGYEESRPVRIGNTASNQFQLDVFGEVAEALYECRVLGLEPHDDAWRLQVDIARFLVEHWTRAGTGIWEMRGPDRQFTYSKIMAWVGLDRTIRGVEEFGRHVEAEELEGWRRTREAIRREVLEVGWGEELGSFTQHYGSKTLDASLLRVPQYGFLPPDDPRLVGTVEAIQRELVDGGWVWRYDTSSGVDGLPEGEGAFLACACWLADALVLLERQDEAREVFERVLAVANDVGLLAEEYDPRAHRQVGNFPLALTHLAVANTARNLSGSGPAHRRLPAG